MPEIGLLTTIKIGLVLIGSLTNIAEPILKRGKVDVTTIDDTHEQNIPGGVISTGDIALEGFYVKGEVGQKALKTAFDGKTVDSYTITYPSGSTWVFDGFPTEITPVGSATKGDDALGFAVTIAVTGEPVFAEAA